MLHSNTSTGQKMVESGWLDLHYQASRPQYEAMLRRVGIQPGWRVLDAGAGSGSYLPLLAELVGAEGTLTALDFAEENIGAMRTLLEQTDLGCPVEVVEGSVLELPFVEEGFDAVWCANTVQYFQPGQWDAIIAGFKRVLRPGGILAIKEFDDVGLHFGPFDPFLIWRLMETLRGNDLLLGAGSLDTVELPRHLREGGFTEVRFESFVGDFRHPLSEVQEEFLNSALALYFSLAEEVDLPADAMAEWQTKLGDPDGGEYLLKQPDFYFREVHGLAWGVKG